MKKFLPIILFLASLQLYAQSNVLDSLLKNVHSEFSEVFNHPNTYRFQLIYTKINYLPDGVVQFEDNYFYYSDTVYNYPASMVKLPVSIAAVKKTEVMNNEQIDWENKILMDSLFCQKSLLFDSIGFPQYPHLKKWIKRMLILSDNQAYTHTYDFLNCKTLHQWLNEWGFEHARISHKFISSCINDSTFYTPTIYLLNSNNDTIFIQYQDSICKFNSASKNYSVGYSIKKIKKRKKTIRKKIPKTFVKHNDWPLDYSHQLMKLLIFDEQLKKLNIQQKHRDSLIRYLGAYPREYNELNADTNDYYDTWKKFFIYGAKFKRINTDTLRSINIIGRAYGFLSETAYIIDFKNNVDFVLSASIYVNPDNIMNNKYNYPVAYQFFYQISRLIYEYEKANNSKKHHSFQYYENLFQHH